jgi:hypothetical protein
MTTEALKSTPITNRDAVPAVPTNGALGFGSPLIEATGSVTTTSGVTIGSTYILTSVPSNARISQILLDAAAMTQGAFDIGVYKSTRDGGAVVSAAFFASAVDCSAAVRATDVTNESGTYTIAKQNQPLWQALGVSADPQTLYDIVATSTNTITAGAALGVKVRFVV